MTEFFLKRVEASLMPMNHLSVQDALRWDLRLGSPRPKSSGNFGQKNLRSKKKKKKKGP